MKNFTLITLFLLAFGCAPALKAMNGNAKNIAGIWEGKISIQGTSIRVVFHFEKQGESNYLAAMDSPDQGGMGIHCDSVMLKGDSIQVQIKIIKGALIGVFVNDSTIHGDLIQAGYKMPLILKKVKVVSGAAKLAEYTPPTYDSANLYTERQITVCTGKYKLPGTLTIPNNVKNAPVIIFVHGSGPGDRDESEGPNKTFRDLAVGLAAKGIATLRYDKRTRIYGLYISDDPRNATVKEEAMDDAISAVNMVGTLSKSYPGLDSNKIYVLGHSLGAMLAPMIAHQSVKIKGIVMMSGPARPLEDVMIEQYKYLGSLDTTGGDKKKKAIEKLIRQAALAKSTDLKPDTPDSLLPRGCFAPYWIDLNHYNQIKAAQQLSIPILIIQGENDWQVTMEDYNLWKENLGNKKNVILKSYPKLDHLYLVCDDKSTGAEYEIPGHVPFDVINDIANWIK